MNNIQESDRWSHLYSASRRVIACETVIEEMLPFLPPDVPHEVLDFGLHINPAKLKKVLQEKIDEASPKAEVLLLGYGLCSMAVVGLKATTATLVIPRTDDCIAIFLGSCNAYKEQAKKEPGTYYLTKGWIEAGDTPFEEHKLLIEKYGEAKAERMTKLMLKNYKRLAFINTGVYEIERYREYARNTAEKFELRYEEIEGSPALVKKMVFGPWDGEFVVVPPGETVTYQDFANNKPDPKGF
ncbi:MAG: DUF1638 domain-containing protein [Anaerolineales bacterium]|nr:DUF1638 domain-containing protein [Anaerolineales bacterium]